jgi:hypothetical protein
MASHNSVRAPPKAHYDGWQPRMLYAACAVFCVHVWCRSQFFRLADLFLASGMVPAYTAAAFAKRMARLALTAPPAGETCHTHKAHMFLLSSLLHTSQ